MHEVQRKMFFFLDCVKFNKDAHGTCVGVCTLGGVCALTLSINSTQSPTRPTHPCHRLVVQLYRKTHTH